MSDPVIDALHKAFESAQQKFQQYQTANEELNNSRKAELEKQNTEYGTLKAQLNTEIATAQGKREELAATFQKQFDALKNRYDEELASDAPVTYWTQKRELHRRGKRILGETLLVFTAIVGLLAYWVSGDLLEQYATQNPSHIVTGSLLLPIAVAFWIGRILVKLFLSHAHLEADALERITMVTTYLALLDRDGGLKKSDESKKFVLATLFRPANTGILKGDVSSPPHWTTLLDKLVGGKE